MRIDWTATAAIALAMAVMLGAFGAHGLRSRLDPYLMSVYERAVFYHFVHALGLLAVSLLPRLNVLPAAGGNLVCGLLLAGIVIFSGSLYLLAITGVRTLGAITPLGGLSFIAAWCVLAWTLLRARA
ncbi:MAG: DUF423 domain-containing protein [Acidobacteria bacterium]|nr:DUF423 domain-containing protein [Acidobacteriota bacterium]